jgi:hypothetical protein
MSEPPPVTHRTIGTVTDIYGLKLGVGVAGDRVSVFFGSASRTLNATTLNATQRKDFMLLWNEAERQAEEHERAAVKAASTYPPPCGLKGCVSHLDGYPPECSCPAAASQGGGWHVVEINPFCTAHQAGEVAT